MRLKWGYVAALAILVSGCAHVESLSNAYAPFTRELAAPSSARIEAPLGESIQVTVADLVAHPELYHHRHVKVEGHVTLQFEGNVLCPSGGRPHWRECVWLDIEGLTEPGFRKARAVVEGTFDGENLGHLGLASGAIAQISRLERAR